MFENIENTTPKVMWCAKDMCMTCYEIGVIN